MSAITPSGTHPPLDQSKQQIRLLSFNLDATLSLKVYDVDTAPPYIALSYTWGPSNPLKSISLNGRDFAIRTNLFAALNIIRYHANPERWEKSVMNPANSDRKEKSFIPFDHPMDKEKTSKQARIDPVFWIDAICIDQKSTSERGHQVGLMHEIFSNAQLVLVWLSSSFNRVEPISDELSEPYGEKEAPGLIHINNVWWLFEAKYWSRMWVVQEFVLAQEILFFTTSGFVEFEQVEGRMPLLLPDRKLDKRSTGHREAYRLLRERQLHRRQTSSRYAKELRFLLRRFRDHECSDCRDYVYALLSLVEWNEKESLHADYSLRAPELCELLMVKYEFKWEDLPIGLRSGLALAEKEKLRNEKTN